MTLTYFTQKNKELAYCDSDFENWLGEEDDTMPEKVPNLGHTDLPRYMADTEIMEEYKIESMKLGEAAYMLKNSKDLKDSNLFYVKDSKGSVFVVLAYRLSVGWNVYLYRLGFGDGWGVGRRVFFRTRSDTSDSLPLELEINGIKYKRV